MYTRSDVERAIDLYQQGVKMRLISEEIGVVDATVYKWLAAAGVPRHQRPKGVKGPRPRKDPLVAAIDAVLTHLSDLSAGNVERAEELVATLTEAIQTMKVTQ